MKLMGWDAVDQALHRLATLERREVKAKGAAETRIGRIKARLGGILKPLRSEFKRLKAQIERWTFGHTDELQERTRRMAHGAVRLYKTPDAIVSDLTDDEVVERLEKRGLVDCVRQKKEPNRQAMKDLTDEQLKSVGCRRESHDEFQWQLDGETEWR